MVQFCKAGLRILTPSAVSGVDASPDRGLRLRELYERLSSDSQVRLTAAMNAVHAVKGMVR